MTNNHQAANLQKDGTYTVSTDYTIDTYLTCSKLSSKPVNNASNIESKLVYKEINELSDRAIIVAPKVVFSKDPLGSNDPEFELSRIDPEGEEIGNLDRVCQSLGYERMLESGRTNNQRAARLEKNGSYTISADYTINGYLTCLKKPKTK